MAGLPPPPSLLSEPPTRWTVARIRAGTQRYRRWIATAVMSVVVASLVAIALRGAPAPVEMTLPRARAVGVGPTSSSGSGLPSRSASSQAGSPSRATRSSSTSLVGVVVYVTGEVVHPGVYELAGGARGRDAVAAAGGLTTNADIRAINLASVLQDGVQFDVPKPGEAPVATTSPSSDKADGRVSSGPIDLNVATAQQLDLLPGVGPATAAAIVKYRNDHGAFTSVDGLVDVHGIGPAKLDALRDLVVVR